MEWFDRVASWPLVRRLPGFRSGVRWKQVVATFVYLSLTLSFLSGLATGSGVYQWSLILLILVIIGPYLLERRFGKLLHPRLGKAVPSGPSGQAKGGEGFRGVAVSAASWRGPVGAPVAQYRCRVQSEVPVTLENVTSQQRPMFIAGSPSSVGWSMLGVAAMSLYGRARASGLEGKTVSVPASGEAVLMDDRVLLRLVAAPRVSGVRLRGGPASRSVDLEIPFRLIKQWGAERGGVYLDVVGRGAVRLQPQDKGEFSQWLAHLSHNKTWQPPTPVEMMAEAPIVGWCQQDPRFTFGFPERWVLAPSAALADYGRLFHPNVLRCGVVADAGEWEAQVFVIESGPVDAFVRQADTEALAAMLAGATDISPIGPIQFTTVGGEPVALMRGTSSSAEGIVERCYGALAHGGVMYLLWYGVGDVGDGSYETWLPHFHTMLATWHWSA